MARNGSGTYNLLTNSWNPATNGVSATAVDWQNLINDVAAALTQSLSADGQTPMTGNLNAGNNKITGLAAGSATGDSLRWEQLFSQGQPVTLASAATTDIGAQNTVLLNITGTTTITSFGTNYNGPRYVRFDGVLTLTHNATTLILPGGANITTAAGDSAIVVPNGTPANGWRVLGYQKADGDLNVINNLNVTGNATSNAWIGRSNITAPTADCAVYRPADNTLAISTANIERVRVDASGAEIIGNIRSNTWIGRSNTAAPTADCAIYRPADNTLGLCTANTERMRIASNGAQSSVIPGGSTLLPQFSCRAWVNFSGTGTVTIRASGNVSSLTDNGTGDYTVNFTTSMPDTDYCVLGATQRNTSSNATSVHISCNTHSSATARSTGSVRVVTSVAGTGTEAGTPIDVEAVNVAIFR
jgi:hypothetical protein